MNDDAAFVPGCSLTAGQVTSFLDLPAEILVMIYDLVLKCPDPIDPDFV
jgi:hypothetical protein